ncbi:MAG: cytochrome C oxidase subunit IV [Flavobacteriales bacterium]|nr:cytochrome C oxidase subunit IV [Flavobacteriales bacterium]|tara:strand:+ start:10514 stop:10831 length:318 start_codon:yes stop_codon:yes gene_type:complete
MSENNSTRQIWIVFWILLVLTAIEVLLGIFKPEFMLSNYIIGVTLLNMTFIVLTIIKAYYIVGAFMHLSHEVRLLKLFIVAPMCVLIPYLLFILLTEASFHGAIG